MVGGIFGGFLLGKMPRWRSRAGKDKQPHLYTLETDDDYVFVSRDAKTTDLAPDRDRDNRDHVTGTIAPYAESADEVDVSAWEMARTAAAARQGAGVHSPYATVSNVARVPQGARQARLAAKLETIRRSGHKSSRAPSSPSRDLHVTHYNDTSLDEELEPLYDDKLNRRLKVQNRRLHLGAR
ncbi:LAMI_0H14686g1_1 [Lachancea mirantina]|uniref:LAMI_0H14686g1_1 n=1 Tax=Lachancea mirantina TaxID=1230905 RepID=A0A1G4KIG4_9SACH|nr:LAMI_0H14686g1_1 [Lachancea mirantina]